MDASSSLTTLANRALLKLLGRYIPSVVKNPKASERRKTGLGASAVEPLTSALSELELDKVVWSAVQSTEKASPAPLGLAIIPNSKFI